MKKKNRACVPSGLEKQRILKEKRIAKRTKRIKIVLIAVLSVLVAAAVGFGVYFIIDRTLFSDAALLKRAVVKRTNSENLDGAELVKAGLSEGDFMYATYSDATSVVSYYTGLMKT